jgi:CheY-like chemotaxis protein
MTGSNRKPILIAEDNDEDFAIIAETLQQRKVTSPLVRVTNGEDCLKALFAEHKITEQPILLLLDLNLPGVDGRGVLEKVKATARLRSIPVVVMTTSANPRDIETCYQFGANSYHLKPLAVPEFRNIVNGIADYWMNLSVLPTEVHAPQWPKKF